MKLTIIGQSIRIELVMLILLIGGFIGVTFWCKCKGNIYEGFAFLDDEKDKIGCGCANKEDR